MLNVVQGAQDHCRFDFKLDVPEARIADYDGHGIGASLEVGYIAQTGAWRIEPKLRFTYLSSHVDGFVGADDLQVQSNDNERYRGRVRYGYRSIGPWAAVLSPTGRPAWRTISRLIVA